MASKSKQVVFDEIARKSAFSSNDSVSNQSAETSEGDCEKCWDGNEECPDHSRSTRPVGSPSQGDYKIAFEELDFCVTDYLLNMMSNSAIVNQKACSFLLRCLHERNVSQR